MTLPVVMRVQARAEFDEAFDWYEQQRTGLGVQFIEQVQAVFDQISATPELRPAVYRDVRKALVGRFPYSVFYRVGTERVIVLSVFHNKRNPAIWRSRA
jgi:plasmid stabilization system protein ParE